MRGGIAKRAESDRNGLGPDSCRKIATWARLLREDSYLGQTPAGKQPRRSDSCGRKAVSPSAEQGDPAGQNPVGS